MTNEETSNQPPFSPKEFIRERRPEKFSDTISSPRPILNRAHLEYHLDSLTSRNQEADFERFALALAKRAICPNLRPLTGPAGGGDSKVDSETFPVHRDLALAWHENVNLDAADERWAFAFSAKKQWRPKVHSDIEKIVSTNRGYKKAFFVSNQFIRDKSRAEIEDSLRKQYSIDVRILDRSWILDRVFTDRYEEIAISELKIEPQLIETRSLGPRDTERESLLAQIETRIKDAIANQRFGPTLVDNCIEAAKIARALERPRTEVEGMLARAERLAHSHGTSQQKVAVAYARAWTAYWWHEDNSLFLDLYPAVEEFALGSNNVYDLELLNNLWMILFSLERLGAFTKEELKLDHRAIAIAEALRRHIDDETKPTAALQARSILLVQGLFYSPPGSRDQIFTELETVLQECDGMIGFPVESIIELIIEIGNGVGESPAYEQLAETATNLAGARKGEIEAASILLERGSQKLSDDRIYDAINLIGRCLGLLSKHESQDHLVAALGALGYAYEHIGLLWAARGSFLMAASILVNRFHTYTDVSVLDSSCFRRLRWIELQLGRVPHLLAAYELEQVLRRTAQAKKINVKDRTDEDSTFDTITGILLLRSNVSQLNEIAKLPGVLDALGLFYSCIALLYALGHIDEAVEHLPFESKEEIDPFFKKWSQQPAADDLPERPLFLEGETLTLTSRILGTTIAIGADNSPACLDLSEALLATLEAMLATAFRESVVATQAQLNITIRSRESITLPFTYKHEEENGEVAFVIDVPAFDSLSLTRENIEEIQQQIWHLASEIFVRVFLSPDFEKTARSLFENQLADTRAVSYTGGLIAFRNIFGREAKTNITQWLPKNAPTKSLLRSITWNAVRVETEDNSQGNKQESTRRNDDDINHREIINTSLIRFSLWDKANWHGAMYAVDPSQSSPSVMALVFREREPASQIFETWKNDLGKNDPEDKLRVTIVRGINLKEPFSYRILIGTNLDSYFGVGKRRFFATANRSLVVNPSSNKNLDGFLDSFRHFGGYFLSYVCMKGDTPPDNVSWDSFLVKQSIHVRDAWSIGVGDVDHMGVAEDDDPIIPAEIATPPVLELIAHRKLQPKN